MKNKILKVGCFLSVVFFALFLFMGVNLSSQKIRLNTNYVLRNVNDDGRGTEQIFRFYKDRTVKITVKDIFPEGTSAGETIYGSYVIVGKSYRMAEHANTVYITTYQTSNDTDFRTDNTYLTFDNSHTLFYGYESNNPQEINISFDRAILYFVLCFLSAIISGVMFYKVYFNGRTKRNKKKINS